MYMIYAYDIYDNSCGRKILNVSLEVDGAIFNGFDIDLVGIESIIDFLNKALDCFCSDFDSTNSSFFPRKERFVFNRLLTHHQQCFRQSVLDNGLEAPLQ